MEGCRRRVQQDLHCHHGHKDDPLYRARRPDDNMAAAVLDRIVHHGRLLQFRSESYRVKHALMKQPALARLTSILKPVGPPQTPALRG